MRAAFEVFAGRNWMKEGKENKDGSIEPKVEVAALKHALMSLGDKLTKEQCDAFFAGSKVQHLRASHVAHLQLVSPGWFPCLAI